VRLDRIDPYLTSFPATVTALKDGDEGTWVALDRSAFYPTAGGQPHDTGLLADRPVVDVMIEAGVVWHLVRPGGEPDRPAAPASDGEDTAIREHAVTRVATLAPLHVGSTVLGRVDWERRFRHMQRHTGQHLLSQAFLRVGRSLGADFGTKAVSLRNADCTLDLSNDAGVAIDAAVCARVEAAANEAARTAMPVSAFEVEDRYLHEFELRRPSKVSGRVRLVAIGDYDLVACGGTHVRNSAELLPIAVLASERVRGDLTRVTFRVGGEASEDAAAKHAVVSSLSVALSSPAADLPSHVARLQAELVGTRQALAAARSVTAGYMADAAVTTGTNLAGVRLVRLVVRDQQADLLDALVDCLQSADGVVALCAAVDGDAVRLGFTAGPATDVDVRPALNAALAVIEGRGGGRSRRAMGAGTAVARLDEALDAAASVLGATVGPR
jgi:alanyl-tRNA synthetase